MKASRFISELDRLHGATLTITDGNLRVVGIENCPRFALIAIVRHRHPLQAFLSDGVDCELDQQQYNDAELESLGCRQLLAGETYHNDGSVTQRWGWAHDLGDEYLAQILVGLLDAGEVIEQRKQAEKDSREAEFSAANPPRGSIFGRGIVRIPGL